MIPTEWLTGAVLAVIGVLAIWFGGRKSAKTAIKAKEAEDHVVLTESALDGAEVAMAFKPRAEYPKAFRFFKLFR